MTRLPAWELLWSQEDYSPHWKIKTIPREVSEAVDSGWFPPGAAVLDIGCGTGEIAAWLAERGFNVLGIDVDAAIQRAKAQHCNVQGNLEFQTLDVCGVASPLARFDVLFDRGCLHGIHRNSVPEYVRNVAAWSNPGARYLLLFRIAEKSHDVVISKITAAFQPMFTIVKAEKTQMVEESPGVKLEPGVAFWLIRR